jgi:hypothetical protein
MIVRNVFMNSTTTTMSKLTERATTLELHYV